MAIWNTGFMELNLTALAASVSDSEDESDQDGRQEQDTAPQAPSYILEALLRYPHQIDGLLPPRGETSGMDEAGWEQMQRLLLMVADKHACLNDWVLFIAINHHGEMLPARARCKAAQVWTQYATWQHNGQPLFEACWEEYAGQTTIQEGDGWADV